MKDWQNDIEQHIQHWSERLRGLNWWPRFVYHFTDVNNASRIIELGQLFSRTECIQRGLMIIDNANIDIIHQTRPEHLDYVRLYFRPRTPTQYRNEGIRPLKQRDSGGAHCPIPVFFCFDAFGILSRSDSEFSNGNMASQEVAKGSSREFFSSIPFQFVFHNGSFSRDTRDTIIFHRNAEVLVPKSLELRPHLKFIACRSAAERQTLLYLLPEKLRNTFSTIIRIGDTGMFERKWTFVEEVTVVEESVIFQFNPNSKTPGPFAVKMEYKELGETDATTWNGISANLTGNKRVRIRNATRGEINLFLDDSLAYADNIIFDDTPL